MSRAAITHQRYLARVGAEETPTLPSAGSALGVLRGEPGAIPKMILHFIGRSLIVGIGVLVASGGDAVAAFKYGLAGAASIEVFILIYMTRYL